MTSPFHEAASGGVNVGLVLELIALSSHWKSWCSSWCEGEESWWSGEGERVLQDFSARPVGLSERLQL